MHKPKLLISYDYDMWPHSDRVVHSMGYLIHQAFKEYFDVYKRGEIDPMSADLVFNQPPFKLYGGTGNEIFVKGKKTFLYDSVSVENISYQYFNQSDHIYYPQPSDKEYYPKEKSSLLLGSVNSEYHYYKDEKMEYDIGFLGSEVDCWRKNLLNEVERNFKMLRSTFGRFQLGEESARALSRCRIVLSIKDSYKPQNKGIEHRLFSFGNIRPIAVHYNSDYDVIGKPDVDFIPYENDSSLIEKVKYYLEHQDELEKIGINLKRKLKKYTLPIFVRQVYNDFLNL